MRRLPRSKLAVALVGLLAGAAVIATPMTTPPAASADTFYDPPSPLPDGEPGDIIRSEPTTFYLDPAKTLEANADAYRVMYLSTDTHGDPMAVTGTLLRSNYPWMGVGPRPIIGFAVGTQGLADKCAPSKRMAAGLEYEGAFLEGLLERGYGVAITDYQGLGTPGNHTYVIRAAEANAVLDSVRAAQRLPDVKLPDSGPVLTAGYSQGGGASGAAAEIAHSYAPELDLLGSYSGAPPADKKVVGRHLDGSHAAGLLGYAIVGLDAAYPELGIDDLLNEEGKKQREQLESECVEETLVNHAFKESKNFTKDGRAVTEYMDEEPFDSTVEAQKLGNRSPEVPTLVLHSRADDIVPYEQGRQMARDWCDLGANVRFKTLETATHVGAIPEASSTAFMWMEERISGFPQFSNCGTF
ncbi:lipase family protein [Haloechinothrix salitolerans]|uniref:Lipase family protein n=1 Tax=Haloechinothrix salitolerans TaxID=926830 RepID=A0ABW2BYW6_9PSEU